MKRKVCFIIFVLFMALPQGSAFSFELTDVKPDDSFIQNYGRDVQSDIAYLAEIANSYSDKYVVNKEDYIDCAPIDLFYNQLSQSLTLNELDSEKTDFNMDGIYMDKDYRTQLKQFHIVAGLAGYKAEFEPIAFFHIHRNIALIGGYVSYIKTYENPDDAYWQYVCAVQDMTREIVQYDTRIKLLNKFQEINNFIDQDRSMKIFVMVDGKIDGIFLEGGSEKCN